MLYTVNVGDIEKALIELGGEARAIEIQDHILSTRCSGVVPPNYQDLRSFRQTIQRKIEDYCPEADGFERGRKQAKFQRVQRGVYRTTDFETAVFPMIEEVLFGGSYVEGATRTVVVNYYERSAAARKKCIDYYGTSCIVCEFDFEKQYGQLGKAFIHVHHLVPLSSIATTYVVNPINDLRLVCANCHAMLHRTEPAMSIEKLRGILADAPISRKDKITVQTPDLAEL